jgi:hypothetical protein
MNAGLTLEGGHLLSRLGGVETKELGELGTVLGVLVNTELDVLAEGLVELVEAADLASERGSSRKVEELTCPCPQRCRRASPWPS